MKSWTAPQSDRTPARLMSRLVGVDDIARELGISRHTVYSWVSQRRIPFLKVGRLLRFDMRRIEAWLQEQVDGPAAVEEQPSAELNKGRCGTRPERRS